MWRVPAGLVRQHLQRSAVDRLLAGLFPKQRDVKATIDAGNTRVAVRCSRRSGKSYMANTLLCAKSAEVERARCLYLALTRDNVRRIAWDTIHRLDRQYDLGVKFNEAFLRALFPNGSLIEYCGIGAGGTGEIADRYRGASEGFDIVIIDEASKFRPSVLDYLIEAVIEPALMDKGGTLILTGTPTPNAAGTFYQATSVGLPGWSQFFWGAWDNPYMRAQWEAAVAEKRERNPRIDEDAEFRREYFGEWAKDESDLVYKIDQLLNVVDIAPAADTVWAGHVIGVDLGYGDDCAFVAAGWQPRKPDLWVHESFKQPKMLPDAIAAEIKRLQAKYPRAQVVVDTGSGGAKTVAAELAYRYQVANLPAEKTDKQQWIRFLNADLRNGLVHIVRETNKALIKELTELPRRLKDESDPESPWVEDDRFANHLADSLLYAFRFSYHYTQRPAAFATKSEEDKLFDRFVVNRQAKRWR